MAVVAPRTMMRGAVTPQRGCEGRAAGGVHAIEALRDRLRRDRTQPPAAAAGRRRSLDRLRLPGLSDRSSSLVCWTGFPVPRIDRRCCRGSIAGAGLLFAGQTSRSLGSIAGSGCGSIAGAAGDRSPVPVSCLLDRLPGPSDRSPGGSIAGAAGDRSPVPVSCLLDRLPGPSDRSPGRSIAGSIAGSIDRSPGAPRNRPGVHVIPGTRHANRQTSQSLGE